MTTPKKPKEQADTNKRGETNYANVGVMALPTAGYGIAQILKALGLSLPSISASTATMAAPVALALAGPAYGLYEAGQHHQGIASQERQAMTYAPDATMVSRPIVVSRTRVGSQSQSRPIGEMYINPALTRIKSVSMASEAARDSTGTVPVSRDSTGIVSSSAPQGNKPGDKKPEDKKPKQDPKKEDGFWGTTRKIFWETGKNNFGNRWRYRNAGRVALSPITIPLAMNGFLGGAGMLIGIGQKSSTSAGNSFKSGYNLIMGSNNNENNLTHTNSANTSEQGTVTTTPSTPTSEQDTVIITPSTPTTEGSAVIDEMRRRLKNDF